MRRRARNALDGAVGCGVAFFVRSLSVSIFRLADRKEVNEMRRLMRLAGLALVASLVIGGAAAASASAAGIVLLNGATYPQGFSVKSGNVSTLTAGTVLTVTCSTLLGSGTLWSATDALLSLLWHGCKESANNSCQSAGEPTGLIHALVLGLPVWLDKALTKPGLLFERHQGNADIAHFTCAGTATLVLVKGTVLGHITKPAKEEKSHSLEVEVNAVAGSLQEFEKVEEGTVVDKLEAFVNGVKATSATEEVKPAIAEFTNAGVEAEFR
jgi:hypothetical protein